MKIRIFLALGVIGLGILMWMNREAKQTMSSLAVEHPQHVKSDMRSLQVLDYASTAVVAKPVLSRAGGSSPREARRVAASQMPNTAVKGRDVKGMLTEKKSGYSWSKTLRAVQESKLVKGEVEIVRIAGFVVVERGEADREGLYLVSTPEIIQPGVYTGDVVVVAKGNDFEGYLKTNAIKFSKVGESYFVRLASVSEAVKFAEVVRGEWPGAVVDLDVLKWVNRAL